MQREYRHNDGDAQKVLRVRPGGGGPSGRHRRHPVHHKDSGHGNARQAKEGPRPANVRRRQRPYRRRVLRDWPQLRCHEQH